uniref:Uncharacterized protein n=1 Tax=Arundo donax TaxID=35708 RepID=A0A0A9G5G4_ARUDO
MPPSPTPVRGAVPLLLFASALPPHPCSICRHRPHRRRSLLATAERAPPTTTLTPQVRVPRPLRHPHLHRLLWLKRMGNRRHRRSGGRTDSQPPCVAGSVESVAERIHEACARRWLSVCPAPSRRRKDESTRPTHAACSGGWLTPSRRRTDGSMRLAHAARSTASSRRPCVVRRCLIPLHGLAQCADALEPCIDGSVLEVSLLFSMVVDGYGLSSTGK